QSGRPLRLSRRLTRRPPHRFILRLDQHPGRGEQHRHRLRLIDETRQQRPQILLREQGVHGTQLAGGVEGVVILGVARVTTRSKQATKFRYKFTTSVNTALCRTRTKVNRHQKSPSGINSIIESSERSKTSQADTKRFPLNSLRPVTMFAFKNTDPLDVKKT